uniref:Uncharacterized protein n=2 Tax=Oryza sativa subsp. japonica TaxID=39947 RepID=Q10GQ2_ORYSJ|nr:hypothetical protein [Oryza sativa Japonica Group]ABF97649.1 hypothetical protein LOC_Os03g42140 [Oryza sativa Japonica Group]
MASTGDGAPGAGGNGGAPGDNTNGGNSASQSSGGTLTGYTFTFQIEHVRTVAAAAKHPSSEEDAHA